MYERPEPGDYFFDNVFRKRPEWKLRVRPDDFVYYDVDDVLQGTLRDWVLQPGTLLVPELLGGDDLVATEVPERSGPTWVVSEIPVVLSPSEGAWIVGWGDRRDLTRACQEVHAWRDLVVGLLVDRCGWRRESIPLGLVILVTHHARSEAVVPSGTDDITVFGKRELVRLPQLLGDLGTPGAAEDDPRRALRLISDLLDIGHFSDGNRSMGLELQLPAWMVRAGRSRH